MTRKYVLTGGPGAGKSSLLAALQASGFAVSEEVSRRLIRTHAAAQSDCLPWLDLRCFAAKALQEMEREWHRASVHTVTFFDRGIPDLVAYLEAGGQPAGPEFTDAIGRLPYSDPVFLLPPWPEIYVNDPERWQTFAEAESLYRAICNVYRKAGYTCITVPAGTLEDRVAFIGAQLKKINRY